MFNIEKILIGLILGSFFVIFLNVFNAISFSNLYQLVFFFIVGVLLGYGLVEFTVRMIKDR